MIGSDKGFNGGSHQAPMAEINTTPLVDVMLVLLVIFIITAPLLTHAVKIDLPQASSQPLVEKPEVVTLSLDQNDALFWNDQAISEQDLADRLKLAANQTPQPELHIRADKETRYQRLAGLMSQVQTSGIQKLGFVTTLEQAAAK
jgi:biopolymer transport protein ExbD